MLPEVIQVNCGGLVASLTTLDAPVECNQRLGRPNTPIMAIIAVPPLNTRLGGVH